MFVKDFSKPTNSKMLNETLAKKFGQRVNLEKYTLEQLMDARNKLRTQLSKVETKESFDSVQGESYQKTRLLHDLLNHAIDERNQYIQEDVNLLEGAEDEAEIIIAAKDMVGKITGWMEDTAEMQAQSMLELADSIRDEMGSEKSEKFTGMVSPSLEQLYKNMEEVRKTMIDSVGLLTGQYSGAEPMGEPDDSVDKVADEPMGTDDLDADSDISTDADTDDFSASGAAAGGMEPGGRERRESVQRDKKKV